MSLNGVKPAPLGSVRDTIMTRMFMMQQAKEYESLSALAMAIAGANDLKKENISNIMNVLNTHKETMGYKKWSVDKKKQRVDRLATDKDLMDKVAKLGRK